MLKWISTKSWHWVIIVDSLITVVLLGINAILEKRSTWIFSCGYMAVILLVIEGIIMMNKMNQAHRYYLGVWIGGIYAMIGCGGGTRRKLYAAKFVFLVMLMGLIVFNYGTKFTLPQENMEFTYDDSTLREVFADILSRDMDDPWNNTIASGGNIRYLRYLYPSYIGNSTCKESVLEEKIMTDSLKSKYISLTNDQKELIALCDDKYEKIYDDYGLILYQTR